MNRICLQVAALLALAGLAGVSAAAGDATAGKSKAMLCAACHGADGNSANPEWPKLAGQSHRYLVRQTIAIKTGNGRKNALMAPMVAALSDQDIEDIAAYFASQTGSTGIADAALAGKGERLYRGGNATTGVAACMSCHGPAGDGNAPAGFPRVAGQHAAYTAKQLRAFRAGARTTDANGMMRSLAKKLSDDEIAAVAEYMAGLHSLR